MDRSRVSACSIPLREQSLDHALRVIAESGFRKVDLLARMPHFSVTDPDYDLAELERLCDVHGVRIANIGAYCGREACSLDAAVRAAAMKEMNLTLASARRLGSRTVRVAPGSGRREEIDTLVPFFQAAAEIAERDQIWLGIENHGTEISGDPDRVRVNSPRVKMMSGPRTCSRNSTMGGWAINWATARLCHWGSR